MMRNAVRFSALEQEVNPVDSLEQGKYRLGVLDVLDMKNIAAESIRHKFVSAECGRASFEYVKKNIELAISDKIDATVTGPINKEAINLAGFHYAGHTEIYADYTRTKDYAMMLMHGEFRVIHVSTHVSLREACDRVKKDRDKRFQIYKRANEYIAAQALWVSTAAPLSLYGVNEELEFVPQVSQYLYLDYSSVTDNHWSLREEK